jgi:hypothetical protein
MLLELHKFEIGDLVYEITRPHQVMIITKRNGLVYICKPSNERENALAFIERDLRKSPMHKSARII